MAEALKVREAEINKLLIAEPVDLKALRKISRLEGGFLTNQIRARVWPKLLNINRFDIPDYRSFIDPHRDDTQVSVDIERSLWRIDKTQNWREAYREDRRKALCDIIMAILCRNSDIYYYQGFHDIVSVFLLVVEDDHVAFALSEVVSRDYISDFMNCDFEVIGKAMKMLYVIIKASDTALYRFLTEAGAEPYFATSWLLTWFSHDLPLILDAARIFDALLCSHPLFCYYICAAYVIHLRSEIMAAECDFSAVHDVVVRAVREFGFPAEKVIAQADLLFARTPPEVLKKLCDPDLQKLIYYNQIAAMCKPHVFLDSATSDWTLLKSQRYAPPSLSSSSTSSHPSGRHKYQTKSTPSTVTASAYMSSRSSFYLEHNYVDLMNYLGYSTEAYNVVDAAILATNKLKTQHSTHNNHNKTQETIIETNNKAHNKHKEGNNKHDTKEKGKFINNRVIWAAALFAGGVVSYGFFFGR